MGDSPKYYPPPYHHSNRETSLFNRIKSFKKLFHNILTNKTHPTSYSTMNYPAASCGVSKVATSTYNPICYTALFSLRFYRLFYNFFPVPVLSHIYL